MSQTNIDDFLKSSKRPLTPPPFLWQTMLQLFGKASTIVFLHGFILWTNISDHLKKILDGCDPEGLEMCKKKPTNREPEQSVKRSHRPVKDVPDPVDRGVAGKVVRGVHLEDHHHYVRCHPSLCPFPGATFYSAIKIDEKNPSTRRWIFFIYQ